MTKSHTRSIAVKAHSYGGLNFLAKGLPDLYCFDQELGCAIKTYEYLWSGKIVTLQMCAQNELADKSYNRIQIESSRGIEAGPTDYDATKDEYKIISCSIGSVTQHPFEVRFKAGTWYGPKEEDLLWTCYLTQNLYRKEDTYVNGYHLQFPYFVVPYQFTVLDRNVVVMAGADVIYRGAGAATKQEFAFFLFEFDEENNIWKYLDHKDVSASPGDHISYESKTFELTKDLEPLFSVGIYYYDVQNAIYRLYYGVCWRVKKTDTTSYTSITVYTEQP